MEESRRIVSQETEPKAVGLRSSGTHEIDPLVEEERKHLRFSHIQELLIQTSTRAIIISDRFAALAPLKEFPGSR